MAIISTQISGFLFYQQVLTINLQSLSLWAWESDVRSCLERCCPWHFFPLNRWRSSHESPEPTPKEKENVNKYKQRIKRLVKGVFSEHYLLVSMSYRKANITFWGSHWSISSVIISLRLQCYQQPCPLDHQSLKKSFMCNNLHPTYSPFMEKGSMKPSSFP